MANSEFIFETHAELTKSLSVAGRPIKGLIDEIQKVYLADERPWVIGFSGGKDSTAVLSLVYSAISMLKIKDLTKPIYVISSDTLVETPVVVDLLNRTLERIANKAESNNFPITTHKALPKQDQTFWVNLLGRGYPAPRKNFRWCTERMKIDPVSRFIISTAAEGGEVVVALGSRRQESASRAQVIAKHKIDGSNLARHASLPNAYTYMPIEDWSADEVWEYLMSSPSPWGESHKELFDLYKGSNQGECPLVIDKSTPSCGNSRFGCWTCTVVNEDKALHSLVETGMDWMKPLLDFRNELFESTAPENKTKYRNYKRRTGKVTYATNQDINDDSVKEIKHVPGPYLMKWRQKWIKDLLKMQKDMNDNGEEITLIHDFELQSIRQQWLKDPNEPDWSDSLPNIFAEVYPEHSFEWAENDSGVFTKHDEKILSDLSEKHTVPSELIVKLIEEEIVSSGLGKRRGVIKKIEGVLKNDWEDLETVMKRKSKQEKETAWDDKLKQLSDLYEQVDTL